MDKAAILQIIKSPSERSHLILIKFGTQQHIWNSRDQILNFIARQHTCQLILYICQQEVKVIWQKAPHGGPIPRLGVTPGGRKLYHWIPGVGFPISVP